MAKQRVVNTKFWDDTYIKTLDPIEKLLFLYFLTNPLTNISGIYEISVERVAFDTGIEEKVIDEILKRFKKQDKMIYHSGWLKIINFVKNQAQNPSVLEGIKRELEQIPKDVLDRLGQAGDRLGQEGPLNLTKPNLTKPNLTADKVGSEVQKIVNYFFELKGWADKEKDYYKKNKIVYSRHLRPAQDLLALCEGDLEEAKSCLKKLADWATSRELDWSIETVFKKWYDLDILKPKEKKPYYRGNRVFEMMGRKYVLQPNGEKLEFAGKESELVYK